MPSPHENGPSQNSVSQSHSRAKRLKKLALIAAVVGVVILVAAYAVTSWAKREVYSQAAALKQKGINIEIHQLGLSGILFDVEIPKHQVKVSDVKLHWRLAHLFPLQIGFAWKNHFKEFVYDVHRFDDVEISVVGFARPTTESTTEEMLHLDLNIEGRADDQNFALVLGQTSLHMDKSQNWAATTELAASRGLQKISFPKISMASNNSKFSVEASNTAQCLVVGGFDLADCALSASLDESRAGVLAFSAKKTGAKSKITALDFDSTFSLGEKKSITLRLKGQHNRGEMFTLYKDLKVNFSTDEKDLSAYRLTVNCPKDCLDLHFSKEIQIPVGGIKFASFLKPTADATAWDKGTRYDLVIDTVDAGFYEDLVIGLLGVKYIVKSSGKVQRAGLLKGDLLVRESNRNYDATSDYSYDFKHKIFNAAPKLRLSFSPMFEPKAIYDPLGEVLTNTLGFLSLETQFKMVGSKISPMPMKFKILDLYGEYDAFPFSKLHLDSNWVWDIDKGTFSTAGLQNISVEKFGKELALEKASFNFDLRNGKSLLIRDVKGVFGDGVLYVKPFEWLFKNPDVQTEVRIDNMNLGKTLAGLDFASLTGEGTLQGFLPILYQNGQLTITNARFENVGDGVIRYKAPTAANIKEKIKTLGDFNNLLAQGQQALAFKALDNFRYQHFLLKGNRTPKDGMDLRLELKGDNPDIAGGQKFELTIPITGDVESLLMQTLIQSMVEESGWEEKIQKYMKAHRH